MSDETENQEQHEGPLSAAPEQSRWQIKFKSGQGHQVTATSADEARAWAVGHYGEDYEILSVEPVV